MKDEHSEHFYTEQDIYKAFDMGLETAINAFEGAVRFTPKEQMRLIEELKRMLYENREVDNQQNITLRLV